MRGRARSAAIGSRKTRNALAAVSAADRSDNARARSMPISKAEDAAIVGSNKALVSKRFEQFGFVKGGRQA
jgi:hypothetical protein